MAYPQPETLTFKLGCWKSVEGVVVEYFELWADYNSDDERRIMVSNFEEYAEASAARSAEQYGLPLNRIDSRDEDYLRLTMWSEEF